MLETIENLKNKAANEKTKNDLLKIKNENTEPMKDKSKKDRKEENNSEEKKPSKIKSELKSMLAQMKSSAERALDQSEKEENIIMQRTDFI